MLNFHTTANKSLRREPSLISEKAIIATWLEKHIFEKTILTEKCYKFKQTLDAPINECNFDSL